MLWIDDVKNTCDSLEKLRKKKKRQLWACVRLHEGAFDSTNPEEHTQCPRRHAGAYGPNSGKHRASEGPTLRDADIRADKGNSMG